MSESMKIVWDGSLDTGVKLVDVQHKYLIDIINELAEAIEQDKAASTIGEILNLLQYYTEWHFEREELCMNRYQCPVAAANENAHGQFIETVKAYREEYRRIGGTGDIALRIYKTLTEWLVKHIQGVDCQLGPCLPDNVREQGAF